MSAKQLSEVHIVGAPVLHPMIRGYAVLYSRETAPPGAEVYNLVLGDQGTAISVQGKYQGVMISVWVPLQWVTCYRELESLATPAVPDEVATKRDTTPAPPPVVKRGKR